jgi:hypothetical protein
VGGSLTENTELTILDKETQIEVVKGLLSLPTSALLAYFIITIYRDFRMFVMAILSFFKGEFTAWLSLFRDVYAKSYDNESDDKPGE